MTKQDYRRKTARGGRSGSTSLKSLPSGGKISNGIGIGKLDYEEDPLHNNEIPFCQLLAQLAHEIIPIKESRSTSSDELGGHDLPTSQCKEQKHLDSGLSTLIRYYLLSHRRKRNQSTVNEATASKKKRKSKKKKNDKVVLQDTDPDDAEDGNKTRTCDSNEQQLPDSRVTETTDFDENDPLNVWNSALDRFLEDCCTSLDSSTNNEIVASTNDKNSLPAFLASMLPATNGGHHCRGNGVTSSNGSSRNGKKSLVSPTVHGRGGCHVQLEEAQAALAAIVCQTCQSAVRKAFLNDSAVPVCSPIHAFANMNSNESEAAFDYVAMEEGTGVSPIALPDDPDQLVFQLVKLKNNQYENSNDLEASSGWILGRNLVLDSNDSKKSISLCTTDDVLSIIQQYVIMTGFHPDTLTGAVPLSDEVISSISDSVDSQVSSVSKEFRDLAKELEVKVEAFVTQQGADQSQCNDNPNFVNFGMHTFPIIKETDLLCCTIMERVFKLILGITRTVQRIVSYNANVLPSPDDALTASQWAINPCILLWQEFWDGVTTCAGHMESYEQELFGFCDRLGNIPAMYLNSQSRNAYRTLVDSKIRLVHRMMSLEEKILNQQTNVSGYGCEGWSTSFMRKAFTVESFYKVLIGMDESKRHHLHSACIDSTFDILCQEVLQFVTAACSKTILIGNSKQIIDTRKSDHALVATLLKSIPFVSTSGSLLQTTANLMQNSLIKLSSDEVVRWTNFCPLMTQFSSNWIMESSNSSERVTDCVTVPPMMPLKLRRSMVMSDPGRQIMKAGFQCHGGCDGNNGKIRAVGVLVGLFLKGWLVERYREWNARLAEEELLITLASETAADGTTSGSQLRATTSSNIASNKGVPVAKKTKKKKIKKSETESVPIEAEHVGEQASEDLSSSHLCNGTTNGNQLPSIVESLSVSTADKNSFISASDGSIDRPTVHAHDELDEVSATETRCDLTESSAQDDPPVPNGNRDGVAQIGVERDENEPKSVLGSEQFSIQDVEAKVNVLVYSTNGFLSAEKFLLERFKLVLDERSSSLDST